MTFIALGKVGDVLGTLPIIYNWFVSNHEKPTVMISKEYAHVLDRVPYVTPLVYDGHWTDLQGAYRLAKQQFDQVVCLSTFGQDFAIQHRTSSFQLEAYERAGCLHLWDTLPLVVDRGKLPDILAAHPKLAPTILLADHSQSSPFLQKQELYALLAESFPTHGIIRLSDYRLPHIVDFLSWYDRADALVTIETAHLHLSAATKTPVFALAADKPTKWSGSAWSKRFAFFCRYSEFDGRKTELIETMRDVLGGVKKPTVMALN